MLRTYTTGLLQAKAYRILKHYLSRHLAKYELTMPQWAFLGLVLDAQTIRLADLAAQLDVEPPFATALADQLFKKELISRAEDPHDRRVKLITLTTTGKLLVPVVEEDVKNAMRLIYKEITPQELGAYIKVLDAMTVAYAV